MLAANLKKILEAFLNEINANREKKTETFILLEAEEKKLKALEEKKLLETGNKNNNPKTNKINAVKEFVLNLKKNKDEDFPKTQEDNLEMLGRQLKEAGTALHIYHKYRTKIEDLMRKIESGKPSDMSTFLKNFIANLGKPLPTVSPIEENLHQQSIAICQVLEEIIQCDENFGHMVKEANAMPDDKEVNREILDNRFSEIREDLQVKVRELADKFEVKVEEQNEETQNDESKILNGIAQELRPYAEIIYSIDQHTIDFENLSKEKKLLATEVNHLLQSNPTLDAIKQIKGKIDDYNKRALSKRGTLEKIKKSTKQIIDLYEKVNEIKQEVKSKYETILRDIAEYIVVLENYCLQNQKEVVKHMDQMTEQFSKWKEIQAIKNKEIVKAINDVSKNYQQQLAYEVLNWEGRRNEAVENVNEQSEDDQQVSIRLSNLNEEFEGESVGLPSKPTSEIAKVDAHIKQDKSTKEEVIKNAISQIEDYKSKLTNYNHEIENLDKVEIDLPSAKTTLKACYNKAKKIPQDLSGKIELFYSKELEEKQLQLVQAEKERQKELQLIKVKLQLLADDESEKIKTEQMQHEMSKLRDQVKAKRSELIGVVATLEPDLVKIEELLEASRDLSTIFGEAYKNIWSKLNAVTSTIEDQDTHEEDTLDKLKDKIYILNAEATESLQLYIVHDVQQMNNSIAREFIDIRKKLETTVKLLVVKIIVAESSLANFQNSLSGNDLQQVINQLSYQINEANAAIDSAAKLPESPSFDNMSETLMKVEKCLSNLNNKINDFEKQRVEALTKKQEIDQINKIKVKLLDKLTLIRTKRISSTQVNNANEAISILINDALSNFIEIESRVNELTQNMGVQTLGSLRLILDELRWIDDQLISKDLEIEVSILKTHLKTKIDEAQSLLDKIGNPSDNNIHSHIVTLESNIRRGKKLIDNKEIRGSLSQDISTTLETLGKAINTLNVIAADHIKLYTINQINTAKSYAIDIIRFKPEMNIAELKNEFISDVDYVFLAMISACNSQIVALTKELESKSSKDLDSILKDLQAIISILESDNLKEKKHTIIQVIPHLPAIIKRADAIESLSDVDEEFSNAVKEVKIELFSRLLNVKQNNIEQIIKLSADLDRKTEQAINYYKKRFLINLKTNGIGDISHNTNLWRHKKRFSMFADHFEDKVPRGIKKLYEELSNKDIENMGDARINKLFSKVFEILNDAVNDDSIFRRDETRKFYKDSFATARALDADKKLFNKYNNNHIVEYLSKLR